MGNTELISGGKKLSGIRYVNCVCENIECNRDGLRKIREDMV